MLYCLGIDHRVAELAERELFAFSRTEQEAVLTTFAGGEPDRCGLTELAILSTCNRVELYGVGRHPASAETVHDEEAFRFLESVLFRAAPSRKSAKAIGFEPYRIHGSSVVKHAGRVASGLESMILGEPQILGQVTGARLAAAEAGSSGPVLDAMLLAAVKAGRRARSETSINRKPATVASTAAARALARVDPASGKVAVIGAGSVARGLLHQLAHAVAEPVVVLNRTASTAEHLAREFGGRGYGLDQIEAALRSSDVVISSTSSSAPVVTADAVRDARAGLKSRPLTLIDLAVPRDVDPDAGRLQGVTHIDLDDLQSDIGLVAEERRRAIPLVEEIIDAEAEVFVSWLRAHAVAPLIANLRGRAEEIRRREVDRALRELATDDEHLRHQLERLSHTLVNRLLHDPTTRLRQDAEAGLDPTGESVRRLFNLPIT